VAHAAARDAEADRAVMPAPSIIARLVTGMGIQKEAERKQFFFEKKNQKTFACLTRWVSSIRFGKIKVFRCFFSKKHCFLSI
jgi:hypothetical protein